MPSIGPRATPQLASVLPPRPQRLLPPLGQERKARWREASKKRFRSGNGSHPLGHPTRLLILECLSHRPRIRATELAAQGRLHFTTLSYHLHRLAAMGFVDLDEGRRYALTPHGIAARRRLRLLQWRTARDILEALERKRLGMPVDAIAQAFPGPVTQRGLSRLEEEGLLVRWRSDETDYATATPAARDFLKLLRAGLLASPTRSA